jgi:hypothetical protein
MATEQESRLTNLSKHVATFDSQALHLSDSSIFKATPTRNWVAQGRCLHAFWWSRWLFLNNLLVRTTFPLSPCSPWPRIINLTVIGKATTRSGAARNRLLTSLWISVQQKDCLTTLSDKFFSLSLWSLDRECLLLKPAGIVLLLVVPGSRNTFGPASVT